MENKKIKKIVQTFQKNWLLSFPLGIFLGAAGMWASGFLGELGRHTCPSQKFTKLNEINTYEFLRMTPLFLY